MAISQINTNSIATSAVSSTKLASGTPTRAQMPSGSVLQVVTTVSSTQTAYTSQAFTTINELTTSITPTSATSKIMIIVSMSIGTTDNAYAFAKFQRNGSDIAGAKGSTTASSPTAATFEMLLNNNTGSFNQHCYPNTYMYVDSPATTSSTTYSIVANGIQNSAKTFYINRASGPNGDPNNISAISSMTLMEIAA